MEAEDSDKAAEAKEEQSTATTSSGHPLATAEQVAALSPSPFPSADDGARWERVTDEGDVLQCVQKEGTGDKVAVLHRIYMTAVGRTGSGFTFLDTGGEEVDFILGHAVYPKGLEVALCSLHIGARVFLRIRGSSQGYSDSRRPEGVKADDLLHFDLRVTRQEKEKNLHHMDADEKIAFCTQRREVGKRLFSGGQPRSALKQYEKALTVLQSLERGEREDDKAALTSVMKLNSAACHLQLGDHIAVLQLCGEVLARQSTQPKALYLRAAAHQAREEWTEAGDDFRRLMGLEAGVDAGTRAKVGRQLAVIEAELRRQRERDAKKYDGFLLRGRGAKGGSGEDPAASTLLYGDRIQEEEQRARQGSVLGQVEQGVASLYQQGVGALQALWSAVYEGCRRCRRAQQRTATE